MVKNPPAVRETWVRSLGWEDPLEEGMATHSSILACRVPTGQRSLVGYNPWGCKELDMTRRHSLSLSLSLLISEMQSLTIPSIGEDLRQVTLSYFDEK